MGKYVSSSYSWYILKYRDATTRSLGVFLNQEYLTGLIASNIKVATSRIKNETHGSETSRLASARVVVP